MKLISWNVNGLRAAMTKGFEDFFKKENADIINLKEIANLEKMLEHKDRNKSKNKRKEQKEKVINPEEVDIQNLSTTKGYEEKNNER